MSQDLLVSKCLSRLGKHTGAPYVAIFCVFTLSLLFTTIQLRSAVEILAISFCVRLLVTTVLAIHQRYTDAPVGFEKQVASYRKLRAHQQNSCLDSECRSLTSMSCSQCAAGMDDISMASGTTKSNASSQLYRHIALLQTNVANYEALTGLRSHGEDENDASLRLKCLAEQNDAATKNDAPNGGIPKSISNYDNKELSSEDSDDDDVMRAAVAACSHVQGHNCLTSPCSPSDEYAETQMHLYDRPVPELAFRTFEEEAADRPGSPVDQSQCCRRVLRLVCLFMALSFLNSLIVLRLIPHLFTGSQLNQAWLLMPIQSIFAMALVLLALIIAKNSTNSRHLKRKTVVTGFPVTSLLALWIVCAMLAAGTWRAILVNVAGWLSGLLSYLLCSVLCGGPTRGQNLENGLLYMNDTTEIEPDKPFANEEDVEAEEQPETDSCVKEMARPEEMSNENSSHGDTETSGNDVDVK